MIAESTGTRGNAGSVLISQVLYDPQQGVADPGGEWLVLWNPSAEVIHLVSWRLRDSQGEEELPSIDLPAGATVLVAAAGAEGTALPPATLRVVLPGNISNGLSNSGDSLALLDSTGQVVDAISWGDDRSIFDPPIPSASSGQPLQRNGTTDSDSASDWILSVAPDATAISVVPSTTSMPSAVVQKQSSQTAIPETPTAQAQPTVPLVGQSRVISDIVLSEIAPHEGLVEIYNRGQRPVDLKRWSLADGTGLATVMLPDVVPIPPHGFIVVQSPALNMTRPDSSIALRDAAGIVVDAVTLAPIERNHSQSRYPVHGGGWMVDTPLTLGQFNQPASIPEPSPTPTPVPPQGAASTLLTSASQDSAVKPWMVLVGVFGIALAIVLVLGRKRVS